MKNRIIWLSLLSLMIMSGCKDSQLPTIGRTVGDFPMSHLLSFDAEQNCYRFLKSVSFEAPFADGMAYTQSTCLAKDKKVGRKTMEQIALLHVSLTSDGEYYIIKGGY